MVFGFTEQVRGCFFSSTRPQRAPVSFPSLWGDAFKPAPGADDLSAMKAKKAQMRKTLEPGSPADWGQREQGGFEWETI
jgi:hypothetical protein